MHVLAEDMTRLRGEILASRQARHELLAALQQETSGRRATVSRILKRFSRDVTDLARKTKANRTTCLSGLKRTVSILQRGVRTDIAGVRQAFEGLRGASHDAGGRGEKGARQAGESCGREGQQKPSLGTAPNRRASLEEKNELRGKTIEGGVETPPQTSPKRKAKHEAAGHAPRKAKARLDSSRKGKT